MDLGDIMSSQSEENKASLNSEAREIISTQTNNNLDKAKTKNIKKKYEPFLQGGQVFKYEDNPSEYKMMRKKMQNRQSATRVRGRKKNAFQNLEQEVEYLRKETSQLQLRNAKLQTQNKSLKDQVEFMKTLIQPVNIVSKDPVEDYLASEVLTHQHSPSASPFSEPIESQNNQGFFQEFHWIRTDSSSSSNYGWLSIAIFTIVLGIFILPNNETIDISFVAAQQGQMSTHPETITFVSVQFLNTLLKYSKIAVKYAILSFYIFLMYNKLKVYWRKKKIEKNE